MAEEVVVTGILVKSSEERVGQWCKSLFLLQLVFFIYRLCTNYDPSELFVFICMFVYLFSVLLCGYSSASARDRFCLSLFVCIQYFLSVVWLVNVWDTTRYHAMMKNGCEHCMPVFEHGTETCQYHFRHNNDWINIQQAECRHIPSTAEIVCRAILMTAISCVGFCVALSARQVLNGNHVVAQIMKSVPEVEGTPEVVSVGTSDNLEQYSRDDPPVLVAGRVEEKSNEVV